MSVIFLSGWDKPNEFTHRFKDAPMQTLVDAYNREVSITAYVSARGRFLAALATGFNSCTADCSLVLSDTGGLRLSEKVAYDEAQNCLVPAD